MPTTMYVWAKVALPDPATYFYGFKEARVLEYGEINRALSDERGNYEGADFSFTLADVDRLIRGLMSGSATRYGFKNRNITIRMISDAGRRLQQTPRVIARGLLYQVVPTAPFKVEFQCRDFVTSKFAGTNINKQIPQRLIGADFPGSPLEVRKLAVPIIYGNVSDDVSTIGYPPILTGTPLNGAVVEGGFRNAGFGPLTSSTVPPATVTAVAAAGGALSADVPNSEWGVIVSSVDVTGRESDPMPFYYNGANFGSRGSFAEGPIPGVGVDGTQKLVVTWTAAAGAVKYRIYLGTYYYGFRPSQWLEVAAPTLTCEFTLAAASSEPVTMDNITPGAQPIQFGGFWWYAVMARMSDGLTGISQTVFGASGPYRRPIRIEWLPEPGALEYVVVRRGTGDFDRQWTVPSTQLDGAGVAYFDDDILDTGVTYLDGGLVQPRGAAPTIYVGEEQDDYGVTWSAFLIAGHAVQTVTPFLDGVRLDPGNFGVTWLVPGQASPNPYNLYFAASGPLGRYRDKSGHRYALMYVRGPDAYTGQQNPEKITVNVQGVETVGDGSGTLITSLLEQYRHFIINFAFQNYLSGPYLAAPTWAPDAPDVSQVDEASFTRAAGVAAARIPGGYVGAGIIGNKGEQATLRDWMARFNLSADVQVGFNKDSQFFVVMLDPTASTAAMMEFTQARDIIAGSFGITPQADKHFNIHPYSFRRRWREDKFEVENVDVRSLASIEGYREEFTAPLTELWFVRDQLTASDVMNHRLLVTKDPPQLVVFKTPLVGYNTDIGDLILVTHAEGIGPAGWTRNVVRIQRLSLNPNDFSLQMECYDVNRVFV